MYTRLRPMGAGSRLIQGRHHVPGIFPRELPEHARRRPQYCRGSACRSFSEIASNGSVSQNVSHSSPMDAFRRETMPSRIQHPPGSVLGWFFRWSCVRSTSGEVLSGAGDGIRTRDINLGKVALYQLSYSRFGRVTTNSISNDVCSESQFTGCNLQLAASGNPECGPHRPPIVHNSVQQRVTKHRVSTR